MIFACGGVCVLVNGVLYLELRFSGYGGLGLVLLFMFGGVIVSALFPYSLVADNLLLIVLYVLGSLVLRFVRKLLEVVL